MSDRTFIKMVAGIVIPVALQNLINVAVTGADVMMLGMVGETTLSGASLANQIQFIMMLTFFGITSGATVLNAQYYGKGNLRAVELVLGISLRMTLVISLCFSAFVFFFPQVGMRIFTSDPAVIKEGVRYLRIVVFTYTMSGITAVYLATLKSLEQVVISTVVYGVSLLVNVLLNSILIFGLFGAPRLLIEGAAIGTLVARTTELIITLLYSKKFGKVKITKEVLLSKNEVLRKDFLRFSTPVIANEIMWGLGMAMTASIIGHIGSAAVAANSVVQVLRQLATVVSFGLASAASIIVGKTIGSGNIPQAEIYGGKLVKASILSGILGGLLIFLMKPFLMPFLSISSESKEHLSYMINLMAFYIVGQSVNTTIIVGIFRAGGLTKVGLYLEILFLWGFSVFAAAFMAFVVKADFHVVYFFILSDEFLKLIPAVILYKKKIWLNKVTREGI